MDAKELIKTVESGRLDEKLTALYGADKLTGAKTRAAGAVNAYLGYFPDSPDLALFSSPGRVELLGNHTDHNAGAVMAGAVNIDIFAVAAPSDEPVIRVKSEGYPMVTVDLRDLTPQSEESTHSPALIRGIAFRFREAGRKIGGFTAYTTSQVPKGSGLSSSAAFEVLIGTILNKMYGGRATPEQIAIDAQFAENVYFGKPSGLLDQSAIALGGVSYIDFKSTVDPEVESIHWGFDDMDIVITNTGGDHCNLTDNYAAIRREMELVAGKLGGKTLREVSEEDFYDKISALQNEVSGRAIMRAMHFYDENKRVDAGAEAVKKGDESAFAEVINASGLSSYMLLQNCYPEGDVAQRVPLGINLSKRFKGVRAVRVHGGGFAGTILAFVDKKHTAKYIEYMSDIFGEENVFEVGVRNDGACKVNIR